jgi:uncharacterized Zn-finger protein
MHACTTCPRKFLAPSALRVHVRTHTGEKPYPCTFPGCEYACSQSGSLKTHVRTHTGEKPYPCTYRGCDKAFNQSGVVYMYYDMAGGRTVCVERAGLPGGV